MGRRRGRSAPGAGGAAGPTCGDRGGRRLVYGGIEAGGTYFVCAVGEGPEAIYDQVESRTTTPDQTIERALQFFEAYPEPIAALGIGSFGPLDPNPRSPTFGRITTTPKPGWQGVDIVAQVKSVLNVPVAFDTDVNAAAFGEGRWGAAQGLHTFVYLTIGTGIGGGALVQGSLLHGLVHPEMGHVRVPHDRDRDPFEGVCPFHGDCLEGLASGPALEARWGARGEELPRDHPAWPLEAHYLALGLMAIVCILSPQRIILGGGVMNRSFLFPMIRSELQGVLDGYIQAEALTEQIDATVVPPVLGERAGVLGAIALAEDLHEATEGPDR